MALFLPPDLWTSIKVMAFSPQQWVNILAEKDEPAYAKAFLGLEGDQVLNLVYDAPLKRKWLRLWLRDHYRDDKKGWTGLPPSGQALLDSFDFGPNAVLNWWSVGFEGQLWPGADFTTRALDPQDPLAAHNLEAALTTDRLKAETWASVATREGRYLFGLYAHTELLHPLQNLLTQTPPGREWEYLIVRRVCLGNRPAPYEAHLFEQLMSQILAYFIQQNYVESVEVMVESGVISSCVFYKLLATYYHEPSHPWIHGIVNGLLKPKLELEDEADDDWSTASSDYGYSYEYQDAWMNQVVV